jgi:hypothetical protein
MAVPATAARGVLLAALLTLAGCSETNLVRDSFGAVGVGPKSAETPDFVERSRPADLDYVPIGAESPPRATAARTAEEVKQAEAELEAVRVSNERVAEAVKQAGSTAPPAPVKLPPGTATPATSATQ